MKMEFLYFRKWISKNKKNQEELFELKKIKKIQSEIMAYILRNENF